MSSELAISTRNLGKAYRFYKQPFDRLKQMAWRGRRIFYEEFWALRNIDFDVYRGETVGIIGRNGAGKSTLLQVLCGTVTPTEGTCTVHGRIAALLELGAGFNPEFSGRDNVFVNAAILGLRDEEIRARFDDIAAFADIGEFMDHPVKTYSSGMYARLAFAVAIHVDPEILIVDEILAVGDQAFQRKCMERFYRVRESGCTILFVSHDPYQVKTLCQRAIYLSGGRRIAYGPAADVVDRYVVELEQAARPRPAPVAVAADAVAADLAATDLAAVGSVIAGPAAIDPAAIDPAAARPAEALVAAPVAAPETLFRITDVAFEDVDGRPLREVLSGQEVRLRLRYVSLTRQRPGLVSFVFNLKRHDDFYVCGTTTLMDGLPALEAGDEGEVQVRFPRFPLLAGEYRWRVAINDHMGLGVYAEAVHQCPFRVVDRFQAHGLVDLPREWSIRAGPGPVVRRSSGEG